MCLCVSVVAECSDLGLHSLSVPVRVNIPLLATSGLKALILSELLEAFRERGGERERSLTLTAVASVSGPVWRRTGTESLLLVRSVVCCYFTRA